MKRGAAGDDRDLGEGSEVEGQGAEIDAARRRVEQRVQRVADHRRLLEDLLLHEMEVIALADERTRQRRLLDLARDLAVGGIVERSTLRAQHRPVALREVTDAA